MRKIFFVLLSFSTTIHAEVASLKVIRELQTINADLAIGSKIELQFKSGNPKVTGTFLGRMINNPDYGDEILFLAEKKNEVQMIDTDSVKTSFPKDSLQSIVSPNIQSGDTCAAYAIYHYWQQTHEFGFPGNGVLSQSFSTERSRMQVLEEAITRYYMGRASADLQSSLKKFGDTYGFKCKEKVFVESADAIEFVYKRASEGKPVLMEFFIGPTMADSEFMLIDFETNSAMDNRLWVPRKVGQRNSGGHALVAVGGFIQNGKRFVLVLDSNWTEPRLWDLDEYLGGKTAIKEMIFHGCD